MDTSTKATADTLASEKDTMEAMKLALEKELSLFYDISIGVRVDDDKKRMTFVNIGRTNIVLWGLKLESICGSARANCSTKRRLRHRFYGWIHLWRW
jgi:hypothetical protein